jgi:hypothetical protein
MTDTVIQARAAFTPGVYTFGPVSIPVGTVAFGFIIDKALWSGTLVRVKGDIQIADDGVNFSSVGGFIDEPIGGGSTFFEVRSVPNPLSPTMTGRLIMTVTGGSISTIISSRAWIAGEGKVLA